ncbi:hypothetical protein QJQ45_025678 [Haematococcus lacustris]|nr:hypothetical protein QJQ45_025678 [Haematococcus lacustris]
MDDPWRRNRRTQPPSISYLLDPFANTLSKFEMLGGSVVELRESGTAGMDSLLEQAKALAALSLATEGKTLSSVAPDEQAQLVAKAIQVLLHQRSQAQQALAQQAVAQQALAQQAQAQQAQAQQAQAQQALAQQAHAQQALAQQALARKLSMRESLQAQLAQLDTEMQVGSPQTPRTPLAASNQQPTTSQSLALGKENQAGSQQEEEEGNDFVSPGSASKVGKFVKSTVEQLTELVQNAVEKNESLVEKSPCWKRIGARMNRSATSVFKKWTALECAAIEVSKRPKTGHNMPFFKDSEAKAALATFVKAKTGTDLGAGFTVEVYEAIMQATGKSKAAAAVLGKIALGVNDNKPVGSVSAVGAALKAVSGCEEGKTPTSSLLQAKRSYKRKAASQPSMGDFLTMYAERGAEEAQRNEAMRSQRDLMDGYQRRMGAWEKDCARMRSEEAAADRQALQEAMRVAREICKDDKTADYNTELAKLRKGWDDHKPLLVMWCSALL